MFAFIYIIFFLLNNKRLGLEMSWLHFHNHDSVCLNIFALSFFFLSVFPFPAPTLFFPPSLFMFFSSSVSPELLGVLSSIAAFMALMALFFLYLSNKRSVESPADLSHLSGYKNTEPGTRHTYPSTQRIIHSFRAKHTFPLSEVVALMQIVNWEGSSRTAENSQYL